MINETLNDNIILYYRGNYYDYQIILQRNIKHLNKTIHEYTLFRKPKLHPNSCYKEIFTSCNVKIMLEYILDKEENK